MGKVEYISSTKRDEADLQMKMSVNMLKHQAMQHQTCYNSNSLVGRHKRMEGRNYLDSHAHHEEHLPLKTSSTGAKILNRMYH